MFGATVALQFSSGIADPGEPDSKARRLGKQRAPELVSLIGYCRDVGAGSKPAPTSPTEALVKTGRGGFETSPYPAYRRCCGNRTGRFENPPAPPTRV